VSKIRWVSFGLIACAIPLAIVAGCSSTDPAEESAQERAEARDALREYVRSDVKDPERQKTVLGILDELDKELAAARAEMEEFREELSGLVADYGVGKEALMAACKARVESRQERRGRFLDLHFKVREALTDDEWSDYVELELELFRANMPKPREGAEAGVEEEEEG
jgi:hypothetical protein